MDELSDSTNVVAFPLRFRSKPAADSGRASGPALYEFTDPELDALCRWFSAMKYAFPGTEGDSPRVINDLSEITDAHIRAIEPPRNEKGWLDPTGWMGVYATRLIATAVQVV